MINSGLKKSTNKYNLILGIDTSCDDTSVGIVFKTKVLANAISSQIELHRKYGGVVPGLAKRLHAERIDFVIKEAFNLASRNAKKLNLKEKITWQDIDAIAVTYGPGLAVALEVGIAKAKELAQKYNKPLIAVDHMEGHLLSPLAANSKGKAQVVLNKKDFPILGLLISGGHTELVMMFDFGKYKIIGEKLDDAVGEAYDKVARMLGFGYPGAPVLTEIAKKGNPQKYQLPIPMAHQENLNFSYSGLKTAVYYFLKKLNDTGVALNKRIIQDLSASFEYSAITELQLKLAAALKKYHPKGVFVGGGVVASAKVRAGLRKIVKKFGAALYFPFHKKLYQDNAAMIAIVGYFKAQRREFADSSLDRDPRARL